MRNVWIIAHREYSERIRTRGFLITTILIPVIMVGFAAGSIFLGTKGDSAIRIAAVSSDTQLTLDLQAELERQQDQKEQSDAEAGATQLTPSSPRHQHRIVIDAIDPSPATRARMDEDLDSGEFDGYLWITPASAPGSRPTFTFTSRGAGPSSVKNTLASALSRVLQREQLTHRGIVAAEAESILQPVQIISSHRARHEDVESAQFSVSVLFFVMYMVIMLYGMNVARSIIDEKTSRIFEVLLATIRPEAMMAGKIIGVGSLGLTQVGIWLTAASLLAGTAMHFGGGELHIALTLAQVVFFFVFFILGYLFYASIAAALGAMTNSEQ